MNAYKIHQTQLTPDITVSIATEEDLESIHLLLFKTAKWLKNKGSQQWAALLQGKDLHNTSNAILNKSVFIFKERQKLIGMVILFTEPSPWDNELWSNSDLNEAIYLHRLAVDRDYAGQDIGSLIMEWAEKGITFKNKKYMRLDCMANAVSLNQFYKKQGYQFKGEKNGFNKYEKPLNVTK